MCNGRAGSVDGGGAWGGGACGGDAGAVAGAAGAAGAAAAEEARAAGDECIGSNGMSRIVCFSSVVLDDLSGTMIDVLHLGQTTLWPAPESSVDSSVWQFVQVKTISMRAPDPRNSLSGCREVSEGIAYCFIIVNFVVNFVVNFANHSETIDKVHDKVYEAYYRANLFRSSR